MEIWEVLLWAILTIVLIAAEIATVQLIAVWFAAGALAAFISALFRVPLGVQLVIFVVGSVLLLLATRPIVKKVTHGRRIHTNADQVVGKECTVREEIDNIRGTGRVYVDGLTWTARNAASDAPIPVGETCIIREIQGVKLMVEPPQPDADTEEVPAESESPD